MSKKRLSIQQQNRILKKQQNYSLADCQEGLVLSRTQNKAYIENAHGEEIICQIRPDIASLVVGDKVLWQQEERVVVHVLARSTELGRPDRYHHYKILAANISQMLIVIAPKPEPSYLLLDSYLVAAECIGLKASIVFNKTDLDDGRILENEFRRSYQDLCSHFVAYSQTEGTVDGLQQILSDEVSIFVGQSGVGKSSIINRLLPKLALQTLPLSQVHEFGQHTTSNSHYYHLDFPGAIIDSPGVRSFGLWHLSRQDLLWGFKEFRPYISQCKFRDCDHVSSPDCAILKALNTQKISQKRYENYVKLLEQYSAF